MEEKNLSKKYSGYYCKKCNSILLIQIIPKKSNIKIFSSCKCCKQYENIDSFINKYRKNIIDINKISKDSILKYYNDNKNENKVDINIIIDNFIKSKEKMNKEGIKIKNELIEIYKRKIEEINKLYDEYINNNNIILIIEQMIESYKLINDNPSNILNILNNCKFNEKTSSDYLFKNNKENLDSIFKGVKYYFKNEYIISRSYIKEGFKTNYFTFKNYSAKNIIEIDNNLCASCLNNNSNILIYDLDNLENLTNEKYYFKAHLEDVNWVIKSDKNNLISLGKDRMFKIWPIIDRVLLNNIKTNDEFLNKNIDNNIKVNNLNTLSECKLFNLNPLYQYYFENEEMKNITKMIKLKESQIIAASNKNIFLFKYLIDKNNLDIEFINKYICYNLIDIYVIEKDKNEIIAMNNEHYLYFLNISNFEIIYKIKVRMMTKNNLIQLNPNELLLFDGNYFKIIDINKLKIKLCITSYNISDFLLNMNDGTIIKSSSHGIRRFLLKTMEELPILLQFNSVEESYYDYLYNNESYPEKIVYVYKLKDGRVIISHLNGENEICSLLFI